MASEHRRALSDILRAAIDERAGVSTPEPAAGLVADPAPPADPTAEEQQTAAAEVQLLLAELAQGVQQGQHLAAGGAVAAPTAPTFLGRMAERIAGTYRTLEDRYGSGWARSIMAAGAVGLPIPLLGASFATASPVLLAAELHRYLSGPKQEQASTPHLAEGGESAGTPISPVPEQVIADGKLCTRLPDGRWRREDGVFVTEQVMQRWRERGSVKPVPGTEQAAAPAPAPAPTFDRAAVEADLADLNLADKRSGLTPLIPELYDQLKGKHPGLTEEAFHQLLRDMQRQDKLTLNAWGGGGSDQLTRQTGHALERFPDHPRHGKAAWVQLRPPPGLAEGGPAPEQPPLSREQLQARIQDASARILAGRMKEKDRRALLAQHRGDVEALAALGKTPGRTGEVTPGTPDTSGADPGHARHVLAAVQAHGRGANLAWLVQVRQHLAEQGLTERAQQDAAIEQARRAGLVSGSGLEGRHGVSPEELQAALVDPHGDHKIGFLSAREQHLAEGGEVGQTQHLAGGGGILPLDEHLDAAWEQVKAAGGKKPKYGDWVEQEEGRYWDMVRAAVQSGRPVSPSILGAMPDAGPGEGAEAVAPVAPVQSTTPSPPVEPTPPVTPTQPSRGAGDWKEDVIGLVKTLQAKNSFERPNLKRVFEHLKQTHPALALGQFHDALRDLHQQRRIRLDPFTQALATLQDPEHALYLDRELKNYVDLPHAPAQETAGEEKPAGTGATPAVHRDILAALKGSRGRTDLKSLYAKLKQKHESLTLGGFHDTLRGLHRSGAVQLDPYHEALATLQDPLHALYLDQRVRNYASLPTKLAAGGPGLPGVQAPGPAYQPQGTDTQPAQLPAGSFVVNQASAQANAGLLDQLGAAQVPDQPGQVADFTASKDAAPAELTPGERVVPPAIAAANPGLVRQVNAAHGPVVLSKGGSGPEGVRQVRQTPTPVAGLEQGGLSPGSAGGSPQAGPVWGAGGTEYLATGGPAGAQWQTSLPPPGPAFGAGITAPPPGLAAGQVATPLRVELVAPLPLPVVLATGTVGAAGAGRAAAAAGHAGGIAASGIPGLDRFRVQLQAGADSLGRWGQALSHGSQGMALAFGAVSATLGGFARSANPVLWETLSTSARILAGEIGQTLVPAVLYVSGKLQAMADWVAELSPGAKSMIGTTLATTAGVLALGVGVKLVGGALGVAGGLLGTMNTMLGTATGALTGFTAAVGRAGVAAGVSGAGRIGAGAAGGIAGGGVAKVATGGGMASMAIPGAIIAATAATVFAQYKLWNYSQGVMQQYRGGEMSTREFVGRGMAGPWGMVLDWFREDKQASKPPMIAQYKEMQLGSFNPVDVRQMVQQANLGQGPLEQREADLNRRTYEAMLYELKQLNKKIPQPGFDRPPVVP